MPRRPRVDMAGYYHVVNRGVERRIVYKEDEDYERFLKLFRQRNQGLVISTDTAGAPGISRII